MAAGCLHGTHSSRADWSPAGSIRLRTGNDTGVTGPRRFPLLGIKPEPSGPPAIRTIGKRLRPAFKDGQFIDAATGN